MVVCVTIGVESQQSRFNHTACAEFAAELVAPGDFFRGGIRGCDRDLVMARH